MSDLSSQKNLAGIETTPWISVAGLTLLAAVLRAIGLDAGLWYDEIRTLLDSVRPPLLQILTTFPGNNQHPLYSVLAHVAVSILGEHAWSLRLPAFLFGVASVPLLYWLASIVTNRREALLAAGLLAVSYHHIWFSQNARGYSTLAFWTLLATCLLLRGLENGRRGPFLAYAVAAALGVYTHLTMVFVVVSHALLAAWLLAAPKPKESPRPDWRLLATGFVLAGAFTVLLYSPIFVEVHAFFAKRPSHMEVANPTWAFWEALRGLRVGLGTGVGVAAAALLFGCGLWSYFRQNRFNFWLFVLPGVLTGVVAVGLRRPVFPRFFFFLIGFGLLIIVRGAMVVGNLLIRAWKSPANQKHGEAVGVSLVALMILASSHSLPYGYRYPKQDFEQAMRFVQSHANEEDHIVTTGLASYPYREYYRKPWASIDTLAELEALRGDSRPVWLLYTFPAYIELRAPDLMGAIRRECSVVQVFRGTVAGGDVVVCRAAPRGAKL